MSIKVFFIIYRKASYVTINDSVILMKSKLGGFKLHLYGDKHSYVTEILMIYGSGSLIMTCTRQ